MEISKKKVLVLLQLTRLFCSSFQRCTELYNVDTVIDQWCTNPSPSGNVCKQYSCTICYEYSTYIDYRGNEFDLLLVQNITEPTTLSFAHNDDFGYAGIKVNNNNFKAIKEDALTNFAKLEEINLKQNNILFLPDRLFASNSKLQSIDLSYNNISIIDNTTFRSNSILNLNLKHNKLYDLNFKLPSTLENLELSFNLISQISRDFFFGLTALLTLSLENNNLKTLALGCFKDLNKLQILSLAHNKINNFPPHGTFSGLHSIISLNFMNNSLQNLNGLLTYSLQNLDTLNIDNNKIHTFDTREITGVLGNLRKISISGNVFNCLYLDKVFYEFAEKRVTIQEGDVYFKHNIKGIACTEGNENKTEKEKLTESGEEATEKTTFALNEAQEVKQEIEKKVDVLKEDILNITHCDNNWDSVNFANVLTSRINAGLVMVSLCFVILTAIVIIVCLKNVNLQLVPNRFRTGLVEDNL